MVSDRIRRDADRVVEFQNWFADSLAHAGWSRREVVYRAWQYRRLVRSLRRKLHPLPCAQSESGIKSYALSLSRAMRAA